jgi:hypothetical protein
LPTTGLLRGRAALKCPDQARRQLRREQERLKSSDNFARENAIIGNAVTIRKGITREIGVIMSATISCS